MAGTFKIAHAQYTVTIVDPDTGIAEVDVQYLLDDGTTQKIVVTQWFTTDGYVVGADMVGDDAFNMLAAANA